MDVDAMTDDDWPFDQAPSVAAISSAAVLDQGAPILLVVHYSDDDSWAFLDGQPGSIETGRVIGMAEALGMDPSLRGIADLAPGSSASRSHVGGSWILEKRSDL